MIVADTFLWLHLPKTGGTTMTRLFRELNLPGIAVDADDTPAKHDSIALRESLGRWKAGQRRRFITARRLDAWLISDWHHKRRHMNLPDLPFEPVRSGLSYSLRLGGTWVAADWWLQYFGLTSEVCALRLEHFTADFNQHLLPLLPPGTPALHSPPRENAKPVVDPAFEPWFSAADRARIHAVNPRWSAWERSLYGEPPVQPSPD
ncbi:hypothetical protein [Synechococcus sp. CBW1107]|uniref:hypothetical protein n=1 Tax=Synechococcus sp. CBW1107 TaxID=2789857 RepID=UPI002AD3E5E0|nr:hypothetical protein [Synechococcus sp. CBW1107]CAK6702002.1 hypothetical protein IFHNHDMJ_03322 [Synechococcus sp. CBW1107]